MSESTGVATVEQAVVTEQPVAEPAKKKMSMVVMSGDMDKLFGAFIIANGAAAMGMDVTMFFTFWGLRAIKKPVRTGKTFFGRMIGLMYGGDISKSHPSKFHFGGMGRWMFGKMMGAHNVASLRELRDMALTLGVKMYPCQMSMDVMEIPSETFIDGVQDPVGVGFFIGESQESQSTLFI
jgi:peroxiredoxin family protein